MRADVPALTSRSATGKALEGLFGRLIRLPTLTGILPRHQALHSGCPESL